ncbi:hypothetical protein ABZU86_25020 [Streptomyces sp. NPDC005271]|uniref:hypothetical protein n=1 Tax=unclassified Streptomyces TaxID=2593676 RepID=UPI00339E9927
MPDGQQVEQQPGEREVAEMVAGELRLVALDPAALTDRAFTVIAPALDAVEGGAAPGQERRR